MIPKLIHQTAKTAEIPQKWRAFQDKVRQLNPGWTYKLWTDDDNDRFVRDEFPHVYDVFRRLRKPIMRADVIRYLIMQRHGGVYLDLDFEVLEPFDFGDASIVLPLEIDPAPGVEPQVGNCIFASEAAHPFWQLVIDELLRDPPVIDKPADSPSAARRWGDPGDAVEATGPKFLSRVFRPALAGGMTFTLPPTEQYNAVPPTKSREYRDILRGKRQKGIHWCHGSWREHTLLWKLRHAVVHHVKRWI